MTGSASPSACMSALIKAIRLRRIDMATRYLGHLWSAGNDARTRTRRRILICSAEDNTSVAVMNHVSDWFKSEQLDVVHPLREVLRICGTPNWYATPSGRAYIGAWWRAETKANPHIGKPQEPLQAVIEASVRDHKAIDAIQAFNAIISDRRYSRQSLARCLRALAVQDGNSLAIRLADLHSEHLSALWWDSNFSGQCLYTILAGPIGSQLDPEPDESQVLALAAQVVAQTTPPDVPPWCLDGIHTSGHDARFSGVVKHMAAACIAYERFGRLSPDDAWESDDLLLANSTDKL